MCSEKELCKSLYPKIKWTEIGLRHFFGRFIKNCAKSTVHLWDNFRGFLQIINDVILLADGDYKLDIFAKKSAKVKMQR